MGAGSQTAAIPPGPAPTVGERFDFQGRWLTVPVGEGWIEVTGRTTVNGREAFAVEAHLKTNALLSKLYPVHDVVRSWLDVETLRPLRFEKDQREGSYRSSEVVTFDTQARLATYRSRLSGNVKTIELPEVFHDLLSVLYWLRRQPLEPGRPLHVNVYSDEKIYTTEIEVGHPARLELLKRGTFRCLVMEPKPSFKGLLVKRGRVWAYVTADRYRLPLLIKATTPWGPMSGVLDERSIPPEAPHAP